MSTDNQNTCELLLEFTSNEPTETAQLDRLARLLNQEFERANLDSTLPKIQAPAGTRTGIEVAVGAVLVKAAPEVIPHILEKLREFIFRSRDRSIKAKVQLGDKIVEVEYPTEGLPSQEDVTALVEKLRGTISPG